MNPEPVADRKEPKVNPNITIHVVGKSGIQNELLASFLEKSMAAPCEYHPAISHSVRSFDSAPATRLLLMDCQARENFNPWAEYDFEAGKVLNSCYQALYNVHPEAGIEALSLEKGIRGIFYHHESYKIFPKGLYAILRGELWFSRNVLAKLFLSSKKSMVVDIDHNGGLTDREKKVLIKIAGGATNQEISKELFISLHTVKSHIYSIYKKINAKNRFQATLWAIRNMKGEHL